MEWLVPTPDGRTLPVEDAGDRDGRPMLVHVGTLTDQGGARALFRKEREEILAAPPARLALAWQAGTPGAGLALLTDEAVSVQQALAPGIEGSWDDCVAQLTPWGFDVAQISVPVLLLHGGQDRAG